MKLADFGTAKNFEDAGHSGLTRTGDFRGTLLFMSREQVRDSKYIGPEGDIFSAGAVFYYMLTQSAMYDIRPETKPSQLVNLILEQSIVPLIRRRPDIPPELEDAFRRAVGLEETRRFRTARQFRKELERYLIGCGDVASG